MHKILTLSARELATAVARRELTAQAVAQAYIEHIASCEPAIQAWQFLEPALVLEQARALDAQPGTGVLRGIPIGVKDLMDTADMPSTYGSPIYAGHRPRTDAAGVAACRAAGAIIMGKTVSTEFATFQPGKTRNPRAPEAAPRTPGGSSSGSAAAVAAHMVPLAFGTQTAGSIIRPAAYCGVVGYKPTHGTLPLAGVKPLAPSLDTLGVLSRTVDDAAFFVGALAQLSLGPRPFSALRVGICHTPHWALASAEARQVLERAAQLLEKRGASCRDIELPPSCEGLTQAQIQIMDYEAAAAFAPERRQHADQFSAAFKAFMARAVSVSGSDFAAAQQLASQARQAMDEVFQSFDVLLAPSASGEAPAGLAATGDPVFNRMWTLLGNPCVHVPVGVGANGLPVGVTVVGPRWGDAQALSAASALEASLS